ncbi:probable indole-3-pyruvate monooxygenase YUCCA10 [Rutidosis leptorrhynchoides]|uniref:probable indole-3-pyruvate monooxygenase YUCCA10 n=1 Tax=Rutidosis leptorrhynchoides TaxID=125765 RepID=UPI003A99C140
MVLLSNVAYGNLAKYGIKRPKEGPILIKIRDGKYPIINAGTLRSIKDKGNEVVFEDGKCYQFDVILFATRFKRSTHSWLEGCDSLLNRDGYPGCDSLLNRDGYPKQMYPNQWKGENGLYCVGLARRGLVTVAMEAQNIAHHIFNVINTKYLHFTLSNL